MNGPTFVILVVKTVFLVTAVGLLLDPVVDPLSVMLIYMVPALGPVGDALRHGWVRSAVKPWRQPTTLGLLAAIYSVVFLVGIMVFEAGLRAFTLPTQILSPDAEPGLPLLYPAACIFLLALLPLCAVVDARFIILQHIGEDPAPESGRTETP